MALYDKFSASMFGLPSQSKMDFLRKESDRFLENTRNSRFLNSIENGVNWLRDKVNSIYDRYYSSRNLAQIREYVTQDSNVIADGFLHRINKYKLRCNSDTREFIMSHPGIRNLPEGLLDNFNQRYEVNRNVSNHEFEKDYIRTYNGVVRHNGNESYVCRYDTSYQLEDISLYDQNLRINIWDCVTDMLTEGLDPTMEAE